MNREKTRALREGAMMAALTAVLVLLTWYVPLFSLVGIFACGVPMACLASRNRLKVVITAMIAAYAVSVMTVGSVISPLSILLMSVIPGAVAGYVLGRKRPFFVTVFAVCLAVCIGWVFELLVIDTLIGGEGVEGMLGELMLQFEKTFETLSDTLAAGNLEELDADKFTKALLDSMEYTIKLYFPSLVIVSSMITGYIIIRLSGFVIKRTRLCEVEIVPFSMLKAPKSMSFVAIILYVIYLFADNKSLVWSVAANAVFVLYTIIGLCGLSMLDFKLKKRLPNAAIRALIYTVVFFVGSALLPLVMNALIIIGIFDSTHDYRRIDGVNGRI